MRDKENNYVIDINIMKMIFRDRKIFWVQSYKNNPLIIQKIVQEICLVQNIQSSFRPSIQYSLIINIFELHTIFFIEFSQNYLDVASQDFLKITLKESSNFNLKNDFKI